MTGREAKRWACDMGAALIRTDLEMGQVILEDEPDHDKKWVAMKELIRELERRGGSTEPGESVDA